MYEHCLTLFIQFNGGLDIWLVGGVPEVEGLHFVFKHIVDSRSQGDSPTLPSIALST